jgi:hypothetical protein
LESGKEWVRQIAEGAARAGAAEAQGRTATAARESKP